MTFIIFLTITVLLLGLSILKSPVKTREGLLYSLRMLKGMVAELISILAIIALLISLVPRNWIAEGLGEANGIMSTLWAAIMGTITIIPGVIAFPMAKELVAGGAALTAIAAFITTLTMVGFATLPVEISHFGKRFAISRNILSFIFAISIALIMGRIL